MNEISHVIGVDIGKDSFYLKLMQCVEASGQKEEVQSFTNDQAGYESLLKWAEKQQLLFPTTQVVMEATGVYWEGLAIFCHEQGFKVSIVNPAQVKAYSKTILRRGKTDSMDADLIAKFGLNIKPRIWEPPGDAIDNLRIIIRQRDSYIAMRKEEKNRLHSLESKAKAPKQAITITKKHIAFLEKQIKQLEQTFKDDLKNDPKWQKSVELLMSIPGIGLITAGVLFTETFAFSSFTDAKQLAAYAGIAPAPYQSGSSVNYKSRISKVGNPRIRVALYISAVSCIRTNTVFRAMYKRLREKGKPAKVALIAVARKLLTVAFAIITSQKFFNKEYISVKP